MQHMTNTPVPEFIQAAQSFDIQINNQPDGKFALLTFWALPNAKANPQNQLLAKFALPYDALVAIPELVKELIVQNDKKFPPKSLR